MATCRNQQGTKNLFTYMSELKWTRRHDKFTMYYDLTSETKNNIIVCPKKAICNYMQTHKYYVEYLHFNNNGQLDGFLDHNNNMYVDNNEYEIRKQVCEQFYKQYNIHDFKWANQSFTSMANSLFKTMVRYLPHSSYNNKTRQILHDYYYY